MYITKLTIRVGKYINMCMCVLYEFILKEILIKYYVRISILHTHTHSVRTHVWI